MKILIVSQHYWPENFQVTDIAESLVSAGHDVTVLCGLPNYPSGFILDEYKHRKNRVQKHNGVSIVRAKEIGRRKNVFFRILNYWSFPHYASKLIKKLGGDFDVVYVQMSSPLMMAIPGIKYAKKYKKKIVMYAMDLWPESLLAWGITNKSFIYKHFKKVSAKIYSQIDKILVSTKEHINYIKSLPGCENLDIEYLAQYANSIFEQSDPGNNDNETIDLMFAGYIGKAQSVDTIVKAANLVKEDSRFKFHIVGTGSEIDKVKKLADDLKSENVIFYGQKPISDMPQLYRMADAMLVSLENKEYANMTIPGKVQSYIACGKPVIGVINGSCANFIINNGIGYVCNAEDCVALANLIKNIDVNKLRIKGEVSRKAYFEKYCKSIFLNKLNDVLCALTNK